MRHLVGQLRHPKVEHRMWAAAWLADRRGKARETIELSGEASASERLELRRRLSDAERATLTSILRRALDGDEPEPEPARAPELRDGPPSITSSDPIA